MKKRTFEQIMRSKSLYRKYAERHKENDYPAHHIKRMMAYTALITKAIEKEVAIILHTYLVLLEKCGFLRKKTLERKYTHPFTIEKNVLPIVSNKELNSHVALYFSEFNLLELGWGIYEFYDYDYYPTQVFISSEEQEKSKIAMTQYQNLVINRMASPLCIEEGLIEWFQDAVLNQAVQLEKHQEEFLSKLRNQVKKGKFISQEAYNTFFALIKYKFQ